MQFLENLFAKRNFRALSHRDGASERERQERNLDAGDFPQRAYANITKTDFMRKHFQGIIQNTNRIARLQGDFAETLWQDPLSESRLWLSGI